MEFYKPKKRPPSVPIVPLIDILVTLLFFMIVHMADMAPKQRRSVMKITLPTAGTSHVSMATEVASILTVGAGGRVELHGTEVPDGFLVDYLRSDRDQSSSKKLEIRMDKDCTLEKLLFIQNAVEQAGYQKGDVFNRVKKSPAEHDGSSQSPDP